MSSCQHLKQHDSERPDVGPFIDGLSLCLFWRHIGHCAHRGIYFGQPCLTCQLRKAKIKDLEIFIPPGPRLGNIAIEAKGVTKAFDDKLLVEDMTFSLPPGGIIGVIGPPVPVNRRCLK